MSKKGVGIFALIGTGLLSIVHTLSHVVPAIGVIGLSLGEDSGLLYRIVSNEFMQIAYIPFVALSFWYMYKDHKHTEHERELTRRLNEAERKLKSLKK